jgi:hypothetical protein
MCIGRFLYEMVMLVQGYEQDEEVFLLRRSKDYQALWKKYKDSRSSGERMLTTRRTSGRRRHVEL